MESEPEYWQKLMGIDFKTAMQRLAARCPETGNRFVTAFESKIRRVVSPRMDFRVRRKFDSTDFVQQAWYELWRNPERFLEFQSVQHLLGHLVKTTYHLLGTEQNRRLRAQKYDVKREVPFEDHHAPRRPQMSVEHQAIIREQWECLIAGEPEHVIRAIELRRDGHSVTQTAAALGVNERTIRRFFGRLLRKAKANPSNPD